jgi:hypothetical protein
MNAPTSAACRTFVELILNQNTIAAPINYRERRGGDRHTKSGGVAKHASSVVTCV